MSETNGFPEARTAVLTGAGSVRGIGRATADRLAASGWSIAVLDVNGDEAESAATQFAEQHGVAALGAQVDVSDEGSVDAAIARVEAAMPPIVALVNLAGVASPTPFLDITAAEWDRVHAVNLRGAFLASKRVLPGMIERRLGRIVSLSSVSAERGGGTYSKVAYSSSKAALLGFTRALAREVGEFGVTVNAVAPGPIDTDIMGGTLNDSRRAQLAEGIMVGRIGTRDEVAALIAFLVGPDAGFITAATYDINGGLHVS